MVKRKVVRRSSSKSQPKGDANVLLKVKKAKPIIKSLVEKKAESNQAKVEQPKANIIPIEVPEKVTKVRKHALIKSLVEKKAESNQAEKLQVPVPEPIEAPEKVKKVRRHAIIKSLVEKKAESNQAKVEQLQLQANIAVPDPSIETPEKVEERIEAQRMKEWQMQSKADKIEQKEIKSDQKEESPQKEDIKIPEKPKEIIQSDPIFAEDMKANIPAVPDGTTSTRGMRNTVLTVCTIILAFWIVLIGMSIVSNSDTIIEKNVSVTITEPIKIDLSKYTKANTTLNSTDSSLIGYLREEVSSGERAAAEQTNFYIVDDYGNKLRLSLNYNNLKTYDLLFKLDTTSKETYNITGSFRYNQFEKLKYEFIVNSITQQDRPTHTIETKRLQNVTQEGFGFSIDISEGWKKLTKG